MSNIDKWKNNPTEIQYWDDIATHVLFLDENGSSSLKPIINCISNNKTITEDNKYFCLTGLLVQKDELQLINDKVTNIKKQFWKDGNFRYYDSKTHRLTSKRVCFHMGDINYQNGPFSKNRISKSCLITNISDLLNDIDIKIISSFCDKENLYK